MSGIKAGLIAVVAAGGVLVAVRGSADPVTVLLVPPSPTLVRFAGDVHDSFPEQVEVAVFDRRGPLALRVFNVWNAREQRWIALTPQQWRQGEGMLSGRKRLLLISPPGTLEADVLPGLRWVAAMQQIDASDLGTVANRVDAIFGFSPAQWRRLAQRHDLRLEDRHAERRRFGRFGPPSRPQPPRREVPVERETPEWGSPQSLRPWPDADVPTAPVVIPPPPEIVPPAESPREDALASPSVELPVLPVPASAEKGRSRPPVTVTSPVVPLLPQPSPVAPPAELDAILTAPPVPERIPRTQK